MDLYPKFIIQGDRLVMSKVTYHKQLINENDGEVKGGGWFRYLEHTDTFIFYGDSHDLGKARFEDIQKCVSEGKVYSNKYSDDTLTDRHHFAYDTQSEIIPLN